ncbi:MAG: hypothetical protein AB1791_04255 [Chloroflexota bacterium]
MMRASLTLLLLLHLLTACGLAAGRPNSPAVSPSPTTTTIAPTGDLPLATPTTTGPEASPSPLPPSPSPMPTETATAVPPAADLSISTGGVYFYPAPVLYAGDDVSLQLFAQIPEAIAPDSVQVHVSIDGTRVVDGTLGRRNLAGEAIGLFEWFWESEGRPGDHTVQIILDPLDTISEGDENPDNNQLTLTLPVLPAIATHPTWVTAETTCCTLHVVSSTAAHRDLSGLLGLVEAAVGQARQKLIEEPDRKLNVYLIDRVIGHGGYAGSSMVVSYLDRDYAGDGLYEVLVHEATHLIDYEFAPGRIAFLAEGVAVWATGGHYKPENPDQRVAALVETGRYLPLRSLIDDFYPTQHEIGYAEAAGFVHYVVALYGWPAVRAFYSEVTADDAPTPAGAVDTNLQSHFGKPLDQVESEWLTYLDRLPYDRTAVPDLETSLRYYDVMRAYQQQFDPTAYFLTAWLPAPEAAEERGLTADFTRHPQSDVHVALETMLIAADKALRAGDYGRANVLLDSVERVLKYQGAFIDPLSLHYLNLTQTVARMGYQVQQIELDGGRAIVLANNPPLDATLRQLTLFLNDQTWNLAR